MKECRISCLPMTFYDDIRSGKMDIKEWSEIAKEIGFDAIDINAFFLDGMSIDEIQVVRGELALPVRMATTYSDFTNPDPSVRQAELDRTIDYINKLDAVGARYIRLTAGQWHSDLDQEKAIADVCSCFKRCAEAAAETGVELLFENHSVTSAWKWPDFVFNIENWTKTWAALKGSDIKVNFDLASAYLLKDWRQVLEPVKDDIETIQVNDFTDSQPMECTIAGEGVVCLKDMLKAIFENGFDGWISVEDFSRRGVEGMKKALANVKRLCREAQL